MRQEIRQSKNKKAGKDIPSSFKSATRKLCNFVFPDDVTRPSLEAIKKDAPKNLSDDKLKAFVGKELEKRVADVRKQLRDHPEKPLRLDGALGVYSPKLAKMLGNIADESKNEGLGLI